MFLWVRNGQHIFFLNSSRTDRQQPSTINHPKAAQPIVDPIPSRVLPRASEHSRTEQTHPTTTHEPTVSDGIRLPRAEQHIRRLPTSNQQSNITEPIHISDDCRADSQPNITEPNSTSEG
ncbi:uncharacterized protein [Musca autumnalis]|uniref:uncharacterized protein n=1 Tax=Musca autumnalis TaxID=221902 RepID=UPI003CE8B6E4